QYPLYHLVTEALFVLVRPASFDFFGQLPRGLLSELTMSSDALGSQPSHEIINLLRGHALCRNPNLHHAVFGPYVNHEQRIHQIVRVDSRIRGIGKSLVAAEATV